MKRAVDILLHKDFSLLNKLLEYFNVFAIFSFIRIKRIYFLLRNGEIKKDLSGKSLISKFSVQWG